eukprot:2366980-Alexandrium_andersonii.AAC.1
MGAHLECEIPESHVGQSEDRLRWSCYLHLVLGGPDGGASGGPSPTTIAAPRGLASGCHLVAGWGIGCPDAHG